MSSLVIKLNHFYTNKTKSIAFLLCRNLNITEKLAQIKKSNITYIQKYNNNFNKLSNHNSNNNNNNNTIFNDLNIIKYIRHFASTNNIKKSNNDDDNSNDNKNKINKRQPQQQQPSSPPPPRKRSLPQLMQFTEIVWPSIIKTIKNWILVTFIIRPHFDRDFDLPDFINGTKHALQVVSVKLAEGDLTSLSGLVTNEAVDELKKVISKMSVAQRMELRVNKDDIYLSFPYQVGIMFDESNEKVQKRWVEITMVFHVLRGLKDMQDKGNSPPLNMGVLPEYQDKISICNYRFIKEFTHGNESDWIINVINHFKPADFLID